MRMSEASRRGKIEDGELNRVEREYSRQRGILLNYSIYVTGDREAAKDIVQESFLRLAAKIKQSGSPVRAKDWLFICARNLCFKHLRSGKTRDAYRPLPERIGAEISAEDRQFIQEVLGRLDAEERDLIVLREVEQYSIGEIAELIGISEEAVRVRLYRIRKRMQEFGRK